MSRLAPVFLLAATLALSGQEKQTSPQQQQPPPQASSKDDVAVFRSDVSLVRVDVQVLDRNTNRAITGLWAPDFVLREQGKIREIRNFASEDMPMDVLLLLDVSGSMRTHVERIASAAHQAFQALGKDDRVAVMVFDRRTRTRMPFRANRNNEISNEMDRLLREENFNGGTDVTASIYSAISYVRKEGRREARRAIVVMTDDQTEFDRDEAGLIHALHRDNIVLSLLLAPDVAYGSRRGGGGGRPGGVSWPGGGGGGNPRGGIGWPGGGMGWPGGGGRNPRYPGGGGNTGGGGGPVIIGGHGTKSAGTKRVAEESGGDSMSVDQASALEDTLMRLRQRYALHFNLPDGVKVGQEREIQLDLVSATRRRYPDAEVRYRHTYVAKETNTSSPSEVTSDQTPASAEPAPSRGGFQRADDSTPTGSRPARRPRVSDPGSGAGVGPMVGRDEPPAAPSTSVSTPTPTTAKPAEETKPKGGWPKAK